MCTERFCDDVQLGHLSLDRPDQFPQGLGGIFCQWFQRQFPDLETFRKDVHSGLCFVGRIAQIPCLETN